ncbi:GlxA family transcriptional regulator [Thalassotalea profundi]|uniref:AraC family transcriptional regulator n=1 Tax=Thalassotalea profundi TaxID=2036687 RepID=A0ABQ3IW89_9GAMM|nr:helix-turn-helix domain-containing protein [Thalassotalea profundi]GHE93345.1 AraC family transcriptional regulator [Thalassotalea profundi]
MAKKQVTWLSMMNSKRKLITISLILYDHMLATSVSLPVEMLRAGEAIAFQEDRSAPKLNIQMVAESNKAVSTRSLIKLIPDVDVEHATLPDYAFIPSLWRNPRPALSKNPKLIAWLNNIWQKGSTLIGGGTGVCFMAESGVLDRHSATTHWHYVDQFRRDYPRVELKPDFFITQSDRIYCAASLNALADIVVHIIFEIYGRNAAQHVERNFSHEIRKPYEQQRYLEGAVDRHPDELISQIQFWMRTNLNANLTMNQLAQQFGISQRTLTRRFKAANGINAVKFWQRQKIEMAKELLSSSNLSIQEISYQVGYQDQGQLTRLFKQELDLTPREYRATVRKKLFSSD